MSDGADWRSQVKDDLEAFLGDERLEGADRVDLAKSYLAANSEERKLSLQKLKTLGGDWREKWITPLAVAATGLITIGGTFAVDWLLAEQAGEQLVTQTHLQGAIHAAMAEDEGARAATAAERQFQFETMRSELSRFDGDDEDANVKRAEALLFLVEAGLLDGLKVDYLRTISERTITAAGGEIEDLGVPSLSGASDAPRVLTGRELLRTITASSFGGYDRSFFSFAIELPMHPQGDVWLDYGRYSLLMDRDRPYPRLAVNHIDGASLVPTRRQDNWHLDPRLASDRQLSNEFFRNNPIDRGNLVRRSDLVWGTQEERELASQLSFFLTNATPQHEFFNRRRWLEIENFIADTITARELRATVFSGPLFNDDDPTFNGVKIPTAFWKLVIAEDRAGNFSVNGFLVDQIDDLSRMQGEGLTGLVIPGGYVSSHPVSDPRDFQVEPRELLDLVGLEIALPEQYGDL